MRKISFTSVSRLVALILLVTLVWCVARDRMSAENWRVPVDYFGDSPQVLGWIKAASEGDYIPFGPATITRLNAPYHADWNDFPMYERALIFALGLVAKAVGIFTAGTVSVLLGHILSAVSFYLCCRFLKHSKIWSFVGAALFSFTYYHFWRGLGHLLLAYSYTLPWAMLSCWMIVSSKRLRMGNSLAWICFITAFVMGVSNPYNLNIYVQLLGFSVLIEYLRRGRTENIKVGLVSVAIAGGAFIAINSGTLLYHFLHGQNPAAMDRHYFEAELYALKPMEFFIPPPTHNIAALAEIGNFYRASAYLKGEIFSPYLGIIGIVGLIWLFTETFIALARNLKSSKPFPPYAVQTVWIIFYSVVGGINCVISLCGIQLFRGTNRYSIFISTIILMFLVARMSALSRKWSQGANIVFAGLALLIGIFDQVPRPTAPEDTIHIEKVVEADKNFGRQMEAKLPPRSMVFQLPVMSFPAAGPVLEVQGHDMLRPYLATSTLRFSFGAIRGRNREAWQWEVEKMPAAEMISTLERYGFGAIYINRRGYADQGEGLLHQFAAAGRAQIIEDDIHEQVCVVLKPSLTPEFPHTDDRAQILFKKGWAVKEFSPIDAREWTGGDATLTFFSEAHQAASYRLTCVIGSIAPRHVSMVMNGRELWSSDIDAGQGAPVDISVVGHHGNNTIELKTDAPASRVKEAPLPLAFTIVNLQITRQP